MAAKPRECTPAEAEALASITGAALVKGPIAPGDEKGDYTFENHRQQHCSVPAALVAAELKRTAKPKGVPA